MLKRTTTHTRSIYPLLLLAILPIIFFSEITIGNRAFFLGDNLLHVIPNLIYWTETVSQGNLPLWNPYLFAGLPQLANLATNSLSPSNIFFLFSDDMFGMLSILLVIQIGLASWFMFLFLTSLGLLAWPALLGSVGFAYSGTLLSAINDANSLQSIIYIPLVLWAAQRIILFPSMRSLILACLVLSIQFVSGHPQYSYYSWVLFGLWILVFSYQNWLKVVGQLSMVFGLAGGLIAVQLLPFLELSSHTYRPVDLTVTTYKQLELLDLPKFVLGNIYGSWREGSSWGPDSPLETGRADSDGFLGVILLFLVIPALKFPNKKLISFLCVTVVVSLILALGNQTPLLGLCQQFLPLFAKFRSPYRILSVYSFGLATLSAIGFQQLLHAKKHA